MKKIALSATLLTALSGALVSSAQLLTPRDISSGGSSRINGGLLLEDQMGGMMVGMISSPGFMYTEGFLQPDAGTTTSIPVINDAMLSGGNVIDNAGGTLYGGSNMLEFSAGEVASLTLSNSNNLLTQGILQPYTSIGVLPVTALEFYAKRLTGSTVQLTWKTIQEINNKGFYIERRNENETLFASIGFYPSVSSDGNSSLPLEYVTIDNNSYPGKTYYRLKQVDRDMRFTYSMIRVVTGSDKRGQVMNVWPIASNGTVHVLITGLAQPETLMVYDLAGRLIQQVPVRDQLTAQLNGVKPGTYFLRLRGNSELVQKIIIQ